MGGLMFQFRDRDGEPTFESACRLFNLQPRDADAEFGLIQTDSAEGLYVMLVTKEAAERLQRHPLIKGNHADPAIGVFANPQVESFENEDLDP